MLAVAYLCFRGELIEAGESKDKQIADLTEENRQLKERNGQLEGEVKELRTKLTDLEGRFAELEKDAARDKENLTSELKATTAKVDPLFYTLYHTPSPSKDSQIRCCNSHFAFASNLKQPRVSARL